ncbi:MAG TPA: NAD(P)H-dependent oxidoreductase [Candidatus Saccharimonadales bacterium]
MEQTLKATALVCTLSSSPKKSSSELLANEVLDELKKYDVETQSFRVVDYNVKFGVQTDMGDGDEWPKLRQAILESDILLIATPIWMGQPSAVTKMVLERLDAELSETDDEGRPSMYGKVAAVAIVGNEDGAHHTSAEIFQSLCDVGFTIPAGGPTYWVGEAMGGIDYQDLDHKPKKTAETTSILAANAAHLARLLKTDNYPY